MLLLIASMISNMMDYLLYVILKFVRRQDTTGINMKSTEEDSLESCFLDSLVTIVAKCGLRNMRHLPFIVIITLMNPIIRVAHQSYAIVRDRRKPMRCPIRAVLEYCILLDALFSNALHCLEEGKKISECKVCITVNMKGRVVYALEKCIMKKKIEWLH
jgi:hypothetical protein